MRCTLSPKTERGVYQERVARFSPLGERGGGERVRTNSIQKRHRIREMARAALSSPLLPRLNNSIAQHATKMGQHLEVVVMAGGLVKQDLRRIGKLSSS